MADSYLLGAAYKPGAPAPRHRLRLHLTPNGVLHNELQKHAIAAIDALGAETPSTAQLERFELTIGRGLVLSDALILSAPIALAERMTWEVEGLLTFTDIGLANRGVIAMDVLPYVEDLQEIAQEAAQGVPQDDAVPRDSERVAEFVRLALDDIKRMQNVDHVEGARMALREHLTCLAEVLRAQEPGDPSDPSKCVDPTVFRDWLRQAIEKELSGLGAPPDAWAGACRVAAQAKYILDGFSHKQGMYHG